MPLKSSDAFSLLRKQSRCAMEKSVPAGRTPARDSVPSGSNIFAVTATPKRRLLQRTASLVAPIQSQPDHFHLLWDRELDELRAVLEHLPTVRSSVLATWYDFYTLHFGALRSLSEPEFVEIFGPDLDATSKDLIGKDLDAFAKHLGALGDQLANREIPFSEVIAVMHFLPESVSAAMAQLSGPIGSTRRLLEKLNHCRLILLADAYFSFKSANHDIDSAALEAAEARLPPELRNRFHGIVGSSVPMRELYRRIEMAGQTRGTMMVVGESGTGKELVARAIHRCEQDHDASSSPFVALNCAALPKDLIESELFGYKRGAFSGADTESLGLFRAANGGTLFLDEITEMTPDTQSKLLRAIQERRVRPVGATAEVPVEVRLIASTNRDPEEAVKGGQLRHDLYYRLQVSILRVPPLRDRIDDLVALTNHFIELFNAKTDRHVPVANVEASAMDAMRQYSWPGNVRELSNAIEGAFTFGSSATIRLSDLPSAITGEPLTTPDSMSPDALATFAEVERDLISRALETTLGNRAQAAKLLKISRKKLYAKIAIYRIPVH